MTTNLLDGTTQFMAAAGQITTPKFGAWFDDARMLRHKLLEEEIQEWRDAEGADDLTETIDGLLDIIVIAWGTIVTYIGEDRAKAAAAEVVRSNLDKIVDGQVVRRADGKILKPEGWQAPDIAGVIGGTR